MKELNLERREFLKLGTSIGAGLFILPHLLPEIIASAAAQETSDPHFFLTITFPTAGLDGSYLFDARAREMTENKLIQNYRKDDSFRWVGDNGVSTLSAGLVKPLEALKPYFSVFNGVHMSVGFDGHDQNQNYLFTGDPFGGESFIPHLNTGTQSLPLDTIQKGQLFIQQSNAAKTVPLGAKATQSLVEKLNQVSALNPNQKLFQYLYGRFKELGNGSSGFAHGSKLMAEGFAVSSTLAQKISQIKTDGAETNENFIKLISQIFRVGVAKSAVLVLSELQFDTHGPTDAQDQPKRYGDLVSELVNILNVMRATPYDEKRSLMDVTTVMFSAEFGRTMRQENSPIDATGTDHNPLTNCLLLGGKGIKGGQVIGGSDFQSSVENLSGAHLALDAKKIKTMGRPFDFDRSVSRTDLPLMYKPGDYLSINSVVNTLYSKFGVPQERWRVLERNGALAPLIKGI